ISNDSFEIALGNFNGDNRLYSFLDYINGSFPSPTALITGKNPFGLAVSDFNGDNYADIAVGQIGNGNVGISLGLDDGTFRSQNSIAIDFGLSSVSVEDLNGVQFLDFLVPNNVANAVSVLLDYDNGTFASPKSFSTVASPFTTVVADFNHDNHFRLRCHQLSQ
ncbi:unnamed protein product, partial [Rotaria sp. Silwood2]